MGEYQHIRHTFEPVYNEQSVILILGSLPSVKSREAGFYYGHPRNRFWQVLSRLLECPLPQDTEEKKKMLLENGIAVWDVIHECDIIGSSDSSIKNVTPADIPKVLKGSRITRIFANGDKAYRLYQKHCEGAVGIKAVKLPSSSPANAVFTLDRLTDAWRELMYGKKTDQKL